MNRRNLFRLGAVVLIVFLLDLSDIVELHSRLDEFEINYGGDFSSIFSILLLGFNRVDLGLDAVDISQLTFLAAAPLFFGQNISADLSISGTYLFTRQNSRISWYVKRCLSLLWYSLLISIFTCGLGTLLTLYFDVSNVPLGRIALVTASITLCTFVLIMLSNIVGIFVGSTVALAVAVFFAALNILMIASPARVMSIVYNSAFLPEESTVQMLGKLSVNGAYALVLFTVGLVVIKRKELGLVNAEHIF
ncbi:MAG: hypothetical protein IJ561_06255 [Ruminococcus sp.]|nr:hypothetical protein [Ruminococcus sp.]